MSEENTQPLPGAMEQADLDKIAEKLNQRIASARCEVCSTGRYSIAPHSVSPMIVQNGSVMLGGASYPQAMLVCDHCGNTRFHNLMVLLGQGAAK